jgi:hypothetical protein
MCFAAAMVPMMLFHRFASWGLVNEWLILAGAGAYLFVRFVVTWLLKRYTVHRGMFHSIPAAIIAGQVAFLVAPQVELKWRILTGAAVMLGYLSHLVLDEIWSIQFRYGKMKLKSSFGTALKIFGRDWWPNFSTFAKLAVLTWVIVAEPSWLTKFRHQELDFIDGDTQVAADGPSNTATPPKTTRPPTVKIR